MRLDSSPNHVARGATAADREAGEAAADEKMFAAERQVSRLRAAVVALVAVTHYALYANGWTNSVADALVAGAILYSVYVIAWEPYRRHRVLLASYVTTVVDAAIITGWIFATGGVASPFYVLYYASIVAIAYRYTYRTTLLAAGGYAAVYLAIVSILGQASANAPDLVVRIGFMGIIGYASALLADEAFAQTRAKAAVRKVASLLEREVAEHKRARETLREAQERLHTVVAHAPVILFALDRDGVVTLSDGSGLAALGLKPGQLVGQSALELYRDQPKLIADTRRALAGESFHARHDVNGVFLETHWTPILDAEGRSVGAVGVSTDVTEAHEAERRLADSEQRYRSLFEQNPDAVYAFDLNGNFVSANAACERLLGRPAREIIGRPFAPIVAPEDRTAKAHFFREAAEGKPVRYDVTVLRPDGERRELDVTNMPVTVEGRFVGVYGMAKDVTASRRAERELEASRKQVAMREKLSALGTLVAGVAHEINNPLAFMRGSVELTGLVLEDAKKRTGVPAGVVTDLDEAITCQTAALEGIDRIAHITKSLKQIARAPTIERSAEDVSALAEGVLTVTSSRFKGGVRVTRDFRATRPARASASEISQVLLNLVFNALDAMEPQGKGELVVRTFDEGGHAVIEVADTGPGIKPEDQHRIFTPFHTTKVQGTGLGLSVSYQIAEAHDGSLTFRSVPGKGTTFRLELPVAAPASGERAPGAEA